MRFSRADDTELLDVVDRYAIPEEGDHQRYEELLHGNFAALSAPERAFGALLHIDAPLGTHRTARFDRPGRPWQAWATRNRPNLTDPADGRTLFSGRGAVPASRSGQDSRGPV